MNQFKYIYSRNIGSVVNVLYMVVQVGMCCMQQLKLCFVSLNVMVVNSLLIIVLCYVIVQFGRYMYSSVNVSIVNGSDVSVSSYLMIDVDGFVLVNVSDCVNRYDEIDRFMLNSKGLSVISVQYVSMCCVNGCGLCMCQIRLNVDLIVIIVIIDVMMSMIRLVVVSFLVFDVNWFRYLKIWMLNCVGIR